MGQRLALVLACMMAMCVSVRGDQKKSSYLVSSALEFFERHTDVSIDGFLGRLRPPPIDAIEHDRIVAALPPHGGIRPDAHALAKMRLAEDVLAYHGRRGVISFTIIDVPPAFVGLHARAVILVSPQALALVSDEEFAALVAHEIGHEYVWLDYEAAEQRADHARIRELELRCDGIAVLTLRRLGVDAERLVRAVEMLTWYNQQRRLDADRSDYVSREDRKAFIRAIAKLPWGVTRPTTTGLPGIIAPVVTTLVPSSSPAQSPTVDERTAPGAAGTGPTPLYRNEAKPLEARRDSVIDCGASTRSGFENCVRTIRRVLALLPRRPERIQVIDPDRATPDVQAGLQHVDGCADPAKRIVYLNEGGDVLGHALRRAGVWDYLLAIVVWHEMSHIEGAREPEAQRVEEDLWQQFIVSRKVDGVQGLGYLQLLRRRRELRQVRAAGSEKTGVLGCLRPATFAPNQRDSPAQPTMAIETAQRHDVPGYSVRIVTPAPNIAVLLPSIRGSRRECASVALAATH